MSPNRMNSPCINVCQLDAAGAVCIGCGRTTGEIGRWTALKPEERDAIILRLPSRMEQIKESTASD